LDDNYVGGRALLCRIYSRKGQHDKAIAECERAVAVDPNYATGYSALAFALKNAGRPDEAIKMANRAIRLNPLPPPSYFITLGDAYRLAKRYGEAIPAYKKAIDVSPNSLFPHLGLAATYIELGREDEAMSEAPEVLGIAPKFSLRHFAKTLPYKKQADKDSFIEALHKAGLK
jgi:tetratricopeptide (TPR) repeat protein